MSFLTPVTPTAPEVLPPARPVETLLADVLLDYVRRDPNQNFTLWLANTLAQRGDLTPQVAQATAQSIFSYITDAHQLRQDLRQHLDTGKARSNWLAKQLESIAQITHSQPAEVAALGEMLASHTSTPVTPLRDWNDISRIAIAKGIEQQSLAATAQSLLESSSYKLATDTTTSLLQGHPQAQQLVQAFIEGKLDTTQASALQATLAGTTAVAAQQGMLGSEVQRAMKFGELIPAWFAQNTYVGTENARVLHSAGTGEIDPLQALNEMADVAAAAVTRTALEVCKEAGGKLGEMLAKGVPWVGHLISPIGRKVGEFLGEQVGKFVGSTAGEIIRNGVEKVKNVARAVVSEIKEVGKAFFHTITLGLFS